MLTVDRKLKKEIPDDSLCSAAGRSENSRKCLSAPESDFRIGVDASIDPGWLWKARLAACVSGIAAVGAVPLPFCVEVVMHFHLWRWNSADSTAAVMSFGVLLVLVLFAVPYILVFMLIRKNPPKALLVGLGIGTATAAGILNSWWIVVQGKLWLVTGAILVGFIQLLAAGIYIRIYFLLGREKYKFPRLIAGFSIGLLLIGFGWFTGMVALSMPYMASP